MHCGGVNNILVYEKCICVSVISSAKSVWYVKQYFRECAHALLSIVFYPSSFSSVYPRVNTDRIHGARHHVFCFSPVICMSLFHFFHSAVLFLLFRPPPRSLLCFTFFSQKKNHHDAFRRVCVCHCCCTFRCFLYVSFFGNVRCALHATIVNRSRIRLNNSR